MIKMTEMMTTRGKRSCRRLAQSSTAHSDDIVGVIAHDVAIQVRIKNTMTAYMLENMLRLAILQAPWVIMAMP